MRIHQGHLGLEQGTQPYQLPQQRLMLSSYKATL